MITTRPRPSKNAYFFVSELMGMIPNSYLYKRGLCVHYTVILETHNLVKMCKEAGEKGFTHLIVVGEHDKKVNS